MKTRIFQAISVFIVFFALLSSGCAGKLDEIPEFDIHSELQKEYLAGEYLLFSAYASGKAELSKPEQVTLTWDGTGSGPYTVTVSENADLSEGKDYTVAENSLGLVNLKIATVYYYRVSGSDEILSFRTSGNAPRNIDIGGVTNVRDIGGYLCSDGSRVKQGMVYRSGKFTDDYTGEKLITEDGINALVNDLGIKCEIDFRRIENLEQGGITASVLGEGVKYISYPMISSGNCLTLNSDVLPGFFAILADESNYPIVFHCSIGTDRTGMAAFLMNALLGVTEDNLYRDYLFSNFGEIGRMRTASAVDDYIKAIESCRGGTFAEKTKNYLVGIGVSSDDIDSFISIMSEK